MKRANFKDVTDKMINNHFRVGWKYKVEDWVLSGYVILILILMSPVYIGVILKSIWKHKGSMLHVRKDLHKYFIKKDKEYKERKNE